IIRLRRTASRTSVCTVKAVRYSAAGGEPRLGRLEGDHVVDAGPAGFRGFDASDEAWEAIAAAAGEQRGLAGARLLAPCEPQQFTLGKSFDTFAPMGPCVVHPDGLDLGRIGVRTTLNGEVVQESDTSRLIFGFEELIEYFSKGVTLLPGDVIATGTPGGVGDERKPPWYLKEGDVLEVTVDGVGTVRNPVRLERW